MANVRRSPEEIAAEKDAQRTKQVIRIVREIQDHKTVLAQLERQLADLLKP